MNLELGTRNAEFRETNPPLPSEGGGRVRGTLACEQASRRTSAPAKKPGHLVTRSPFAVALLLLTSAAFAQTDHDNIDAGRPLRFEDAEPVAKGARTLEFGIGIGKRKTLTTALVYGAALNGQLELGFTATEDERTELELAYLHSFRMETMRSPAFALKAGISTADEEQEYELKAIWTKAARQYDRLHLNLAAHFRPNASGEERETSLGAVLGYTRPIGYPRHFDTTGLAEIGFEQGDHKGDKATVFAGLGIRRLLDPTTVFDIGLQADLARERDKTTRLVAGLSRSF